MVTLPGSPPNAVMFVAYPFERLDLVQQPLVPRGRNAPAGDLVQVEESQPAEPIVDGDHHHVAAPGQNLAVIDRRTAGAARETPAVDPDHHRPLRVVEAGRPDVQLQAIFVAVSGVARVEDERQWTIGVVGHALPSLLAPVAVGGTHTGPGRRRLRRTPALLTRRRCRKRDAPEPVDTVVIRTLYLAVARLDDSHVFPQFRAFHV